MNTPQSSGDEAVNDIARRHGFSVEATRAMRDAIVAGHGGMAQFSHPEFGGSGQWMRGGMTMVSDNALRGRVDALCEALAGSVPSQGGDTPTGSLQSQGGNTPTGSFQSQSSGSGTPRGPFASSLAEHWWPAELGSPDSTGTQDRARYAWFAPAARLAIDVDGQVTVFDTQDHRIAGFSQAQSADSTMGFHSQHGEVDVQALPVVSHGPGAPAAKHRGDADASPTARQLPDSTTATPAARQMPDSAAASPAARQVQDSAATSPADTDVFSLIEKLAALHAKGLLTDDEFKSKKADLLGRL